MELYFLVAFFMIANSVLYDLFKQTSIVNFLIIATSLFVGLRFNTGTDYFSYALKYQDFLNPINQDRYEPIFRLITNLLRRNELPTYIFFLFFSFLTNFFMLKAFAKLSSLFFISIIIFLGSDIFFRQMNQVRQVAAISILIFSFQYFLSNRNIRFFLGGLFAWGIHYPSIIFIPLSLAAKHRIPKIILFIITLTSLLILFTTSAPYFIQIIALLFNNNKDLAHIHLISPYSGTRLYFEAAAIILFIFNLPHNYETNLKIRVLSNLLVWGVAIQTFLAVIPHFARSAIYFTAFQSITIPILITNSTYNDNTKLAITLGVVIYFLMYLILTLNKGVHGIIPYQLDYSFLPI